MDTDPISVDLNVDAALVLKEMVGIDSYPPVLAILPNIYRIADRDRVYAVVTEELTEAGIVVGGEVHATVAGWLHCLARPDTELEVRILDDGVEGHPSALLRISLVRQAETHVLAVRCDDEVIIQPVFCESGQLDAHAAALRSALGAHPALAFDPFTLLGADLADVSGDQESRRAAFRELGAPTHTANVLARALDEVVRRAEVVMTEHRDGVAADDETQCCMSVLDTVSGRLVVTPSVALDGRIWTTFRPGDDAALLGGITALADLLPGRSWFDTTRAG